MLAIPSPDLLVNLFASGAQVLGLLAVALGGSWFQKSRLAPDGSQRQASRWPFRVVLLLLVAVSVSFLMYALSVNDAANRRLQANLVRKSTEAGKKVGDTSLKTLGFSDQMKHPRAIPSERLAEWIATGKPLNMIDIREPEEIELGQIPGTWQRRFPDLRVEREGLVRPDVETVLLCDSGNRSSELVDLFLKEGVECWFMIGGYEKWVAEKRPLLNAGPRTTLRDIADYPNKKLLLDTPEVERLVREENALFVDVRYPEEFARGALPGAVNLTLRKMLKGELEPALHALPRRPVVVPCYDKRSSFFGMLLGLRMHRLGYDFRGRYTVPHEYLVPVQEPAHIAAWNADNAELTAFTVAVNTAAIELDAAGRELGLLLAVLLAVVALRFLLLPLTIKADRDQLALKDAAPRLDELRARFAGDPARVRQETLALHRSIGLTPVRNLLGTLLQLLVFVVLFSAVDVAARESRTAFLWLPDLGAEDPLRVLPVVVGVLLVAMLAAMANRVTPRRIVLWIGIGAALTALVWSLGAASLVYLVINLGLMLVQRSLCRRWLARRAARTLPLPAPRTSPEQPAVALVQAEQLTQAGRKAQRLAALLRNGFPVPQGFVVCDHAGTTVEQGRREILRAFDRLAAPLVAVRSSGMSEDGGELSHAGEFESQLQVSRERLVETIAQVEQSLRAPNSGDQLRRDAGGVLVQAMVPAEHAGVLFTEDPGCAGAMLVEMTSGLGDGLVSGKVDPDPFRFGRLSLRALQSERAPIDLRPLLELGRRAERLFGRPQDIEWAYARGRFQLLQSRDITCRAQEPSDLTNAAALREAERARLVALGQDEVEPAAAVLAQNELSELLPEPTPLSLQLMNELWGKDGSVERAAARLGIPYRVSQDSAPYAVSVFGRLYVHRREVARRFHRGIGALASLRLARSARAIEQQWREGFLPGFLREIRLREVVDCSRLSLAGLLDAFATGRQRFVQKTYVEAEVVNLASTFYTDTARRRLERAGHNPAELLKAVAPTALPRLVARLRVCGDEDVASSLAEFQHRAAHDFELSEPRYGEAPEEMGRLVAAARAGTEASRKEAVSVRLSRVDQLAVANANQFEALKEEAKHEVLRELACLRAMLVEIGVRLAIGDGVFWLLPEEILDCRRIGVEALRGLVARRRAVRAAALAVELPAELTLADLETIASPFDAARQQSVAAAPSQLHGIRVAGAGDVVGRARVLRDPKELASFEDGDVLVARFTDPRWLPLFRRARGIITEVGGWLSHAAIQAREHRLPAIVGVRGVMARVQDGDLVCLRADGKIDLLSDRRRRERVPTSHPVCLQTDGATVAGHTVDASERGIRVTPLDGELVVGQSVEVVLGDRSADAVVVHCDGTSAGLRLGAPLARSTAKRAAAG